MTENQTTDTVQGLNGELEEHETVPGGSSNDKECVRVCGDADMDPRSLNRCQDLDDMRSPSPGERRRSSFGLEGVPSGKKVPPRPWPPTSPTSHQATIPSKPLVRRGSLKGKAWPPPGYNESNSTQSSLASDGKVRKGPPRQWPPPSKSKSHSPPPLSPTLAAIIDEEAKSTQDKSYETDSQKDRSVVQSDDAQDDTECARACEDVSGDTDALNSCHDWEEDEDGASNKESFSESPRASRTPFTMSPSPPATPEPKTDPSPSPPGSAGENSPGRSPSPRSASPVSQHEDYKS